MKILLVEDDEILVTSLTASLVSQNYTVESVADGELGWAYAQSTPYDLILLDVNLPSLDGIALCRRLRQANYQGAILLLTAKTDSRCKVAGLDAGADDYVVKPCSPEELGARIRALLRRPRDVTSLILQWGTLQLDPSTCQVYLAEKTLALSPKEYGLLEIFLRYPQRVFSSEMLLERLWGFDEIPGDNTIRTHIKRLRHKLKRAGADQVIENVYGRGYRLGAEPAHEALAPSKQDPAADLRVIQDSPEGRQVLPEVTPVASPSEEPNRPMKEGAQAAARAVAQAALGQFSDLIMTRLTVLDEAVATLQTAALSGEARLQAQQAAHKLAGSLGMFGLMEGSRLSKAIEDHLQVSSATSDHLISGWVNLLHQELDTLLSKHSPTPTVEGTVEHFPNGVEPMVPSTLDVPLLFLGQLSPELATDLSMLNQDTFQIMQVEDLLHQHPYEQQPDVMVLDLASMPNEAARQLFLRSWGQRYAHIPTLILMQTDTFQNRLAVARNLSPCVYLPRLTPALQIWESILNLHRRHRSPSLHIVAVDDDPVILKALKRQLATQKMWVTTLNDPCSLWDLLPQLNPDILMLDVEMPQVGGIELCQVIRSDPNWSHLPILFLSALQDPATVQRIYLAGADDYVAKPFTQTELITRILNRIDRNRSVVQKHYSDGH